MLRTLKNAWERLRPASRTQLFATSVPETSTRHSGDAFSLGNAAIVREDFSQAIDHYNQFIVHQPQEVSGYIGLGFALSELGRWVEAIEVLNHAIALDGEHADGHFMLGRAHLQQGDPEAAERAWSRAHALAPALEHLYGDHCLLLFKRGKIDQALTLMTTGVIRFPGNSNFHFYLGNLLAEKGDFAAAVERYRTAVELGDLSPGLFVSFGSALVQVGDYEGAIAILQKAQALAPDLASAASNYLLAIQYSSKLSRAEKFAAAQAFAERFERPLQSHWGNYLRRDDAPAHKLRIGYVSGDLRNHALAYFFEPILAHHDKSNFEVFCYYTHPVFDAVSQRIQVMADHWRSCHGMSDDALAARIREDEIDVLIDLSGHTGHNRLLTFARKPAPVQMTWLGYQATTGLQAMDYRITEEALDPSGISEQFYSEKLIRLPSSGTFSASPDSPPVNALPALNSPIFTFGCLNNPSKITDEAIALWSSILRGNLATRLMIGNATPALIDRFVLQFGQHGIAPDRLVFQPKVGLGDYLALHHQIDMALDTFPYNGGTTTFHSLWMGVPVMALEGNSTLSRVGVAVMRGMGLASFCADTPERYVEQALYFSNHLDELSAVRQSLRATMDHITQQLASQVTRSLEEAMQSCWQDYCRGARAPSVQVAAHA